MCGNFAQLSSTRKTRKRWTSFPSGEVVSARACGGTFVAMGQRGQSSMHHGIPNCPCASMRSAVGLCSHWLSECLEFASSLLADVSQFDLN